MVSVVIPVHNFAQGVVETLNSLVVQKYPSLEIIVVDDGSTDKQLEEMFEKNYLQWMSHGKRIILLKQRLLGTASALNLGFHLAQGQFVTWMNASSLVTPNFVKKMVNFLNKNTNSDMVYSDYYLIVGKQKKHVHFPLQTEKLYKKKMVSPSFMYRAGVGKLLGDYIPVRGAEQYEYLLRINSLFNVDHLGSKTRPVRINKEILNNEDSKRHEERMQFILHTDAQRRQFINNDWDLFIDSNTRELLQSVLDPDVHVFDWKGLQELQKQVAGQHITHKNLLLINSENLHKYELPKPSAHICVVLWYSQDDKGAIYKDRYLFSRVNLILANNPKTAARAHLFTRNVFLIETTKDVITAAASHCNFELYQQHNHRHTVNEKVEFPQIFTFHKPFHVALQVDSFHFPGGLERVVTEVAVELRRRGIKVTLLNCGEQGPPYSDILKLGIPAITLPKKDKEEAYRRTIHEQRFNVVNGHYSLYGIQILKEEGIPFIQTIHNEYVWLTKQEIADYTAADEYTAAYICVSATAAMYSDIKLGLDVKKMLIIRNGVSKQRLDIEKNCGADYSRRNFRNQLGVKDDEFLFLQVGSLG